MKLKLVDFKSIKITFEYQNKCIIVNAEPFKTFEEIKQKALNKYTDIPNNVNFYYMGQDLSKKEKEKIGTIFNHKEQVRITLRLPPLKIKTSNIKEELFLRDKNLKKKLKDSPEPKRKMSFLNTQLFPLNNKNNLYSNIKIIKSQDYEKKTNEKIFVNSSYHINKTSKYKSLIGSASMPNLNIKKPLKNKNINGNKSKNRIIIELNWKNLENLSFCNMHKYKVTEYCRTCKKFICPECRLSEEHNDHLTIRLNFNNLEENIRLYTMLIQTNEKRNLEIINRNAFSDGDKIINSEELYQRKDFVIEKFDKIIKNYDFYMRKIEKKMSHDKKNFKTIIINTFNDIALKISKQIGDIVNKLDEIMMKKDKKLSIDEIQYFLDEIATKEETLEFIGDRTIKYLLAWEINSRVENVFDKIENTLDEIINEEKPFNLDNKYNKELLKITSNQNNESTSKTENKINKGILRAKGERRNGLIYN